MYTHLDLFSGLGGFSLGFEEHGFKTTQFCEVDPFAQKVLQKNFPSVPIHSDIKTFDAKGKHFTVVTGGFPCQDISVANSSGKGLSGERSGLWYEFQRIIFEGSYKYIVIENSPNLVNKGLKEVLDGLAKAGYDAEWYTFEAYWFGASHIRARTIVIAYPHGTRRERLVSDEYLKKVRQRGLSGSKNLQSIYKNVFGRSSCWPQPLIRGGDDGVKDRVHRLRLLGNSVYVPMISSIAGLIKEDLDKQTSPALSVD